MSIFEILTAVFMPILTIIFTFLGSEKLRKDAENRRVITTLKALESIRALRTRGAHTVPASILTLKDINECLQGSITENQQLVEIYLEYKYLLNEIASSANNLQKQLELNGEIVLLFEKLESINSKIKK